MRFSVAIIVSTGLVLGAPAWAQAPSDAPVATANGTSSAPTTREQIDAYLAPSADRGESDGDIDTMIEDGPRRIHGVVELSVGTGGYRSGGVAAVVPIGERSSLALSYRQTESDNGYAYGAPYGYDELDRRPLTMDVWPDESAMTAGCSTRFRNDAGYREGSLLGRTGRGADRCPLR